MSIKLTKDADALICLLYKEYCQKRKNGTDKFHAKMFDGSEEIQKTIAPKWSFEDTDETCSELSRAGLLDCLYGDNVVQHCSLSDEGIIYMENRFKDGLTQVLDYLSKIKSILPSWDFK